MQRNRIAEELETLIRARYPLIYVVTWEEPRLDAILSSIAARRGKKLFIWSISRGLLPFGTPLQSKKIDEATRDPAVALDRVVEHVEPAIFCFKDFHPFMTDPVIVRKLRELAQYLKSTYTTVVLSSPTQRIPMELEKDIAVVEFGLPDTNELRELLERTIEEVSRSTPIKIRLTEEEKERIVQAALGLTLSEAENVFAKTLIKRGGLGAEHLDVIIAEKEQIVRKSGLLDYYHSTEKFDDIGGLDLLKDWLRKRQMAFSERAREYGLPTPKGVLLIGVQGCGKSLTAKAVASLWKVPLLRLDMSRIFSSLVGASEENLRNALRVAESVAPCVTGDTLIALADGRQIPIAQLYEQAPEYLKVVAFDEKTLKLTTTDVIAITRRPCPEDLYEVRLLHAVVKATGNHRFPVLRDGRLIWVRTDELKVGDFIACPNRLPADGNDLVKSLHFLPLNTRLYGKSLIQKFESHVSKLPKSQTREIRSQLRFRRYASRRGKGKDFVKLSEALSFGFEIPWRDVKHFAYGHGGFTDSRLMTLKEFLGEDLCYLCGLLAADGHFLVNNKGVGFTNSEPALLEAFNAIASSWFGKEPFKVELSRPKKGNRKIFSKRVCYQLRLNSRLISDFLRSVQASISKLPERMITAWLSGVIDGDGSIIVRPPKIVFSAYSQILNEQIRVCLHRLGIVTYRTFERTGKGNTIYNGHITVTGAEYVKRLGQMLCLRHPEKSKRLSAILKRDTCFQRSRLDSIPVGLALRKAREVLNLGQHKFARTSRGLISYYERGLFSPSKARLQSLVQEMERWAQKEGFNIPEELQWLRTLAFGDIVWMPVKEVKRIPPTDFVYDLVCKEHHNFVANGVFTHNCILWVDELEKSFAGAQSSALSDAGTTARVLGYFLTWLQEKAAPCFVIATANSIEQLPPELLRKGRLDEIFFVDLPSKRERMEIFVIHLRKRRRDPSKFDLEALAEASQGFSGAEIEQAVISALYDAFSEGRDIMTEDILKAIQETVPLSVTMKEQIDALREWAAGRARRASSEESEEVPVMPTRRLEL